MRKELYRMDGQQALGILERAPVVHLALPGPILRTVHGVFLDGAIAFHGAPAGEKMEGLGQPAVVSAEEVIAPIPSFFIDPERACPATTYYLSVQAHGRLEAVDDPATKARVLQALMTKYQPQGGHVPITADHPLYRKAVDGVLVARVPIEQLDGKAKLGQNRRPEELARVLELLWRRGLPGDPRAIELVRAANPGVPFAPAPEGTSLHVWLDDVAGAVELLRGAYWLEAISDDTVARAHLRSAAWVGARDGSGRLIATARALSDDARYAWLYDVMVAPTWRGRGVGEAVVRLLLDHPAVRGAERVLLRTRDAQPFYRRFGFDEQPSSVHPEMVLTGRCRDADWAGTGSRPGRAG